MASSSAKPSGVHLAPPVGGDQLVDDPIDLGEFGPITDCIIKSFGIKDECDFYYAFKSEDHVRTAHDLAVKDVLRADPEGKTFPDDPLSAQSICNASQLVARWHLSKFRGAEILERKLQSIRTSVYSGEAASAALPAGSVSLGKDCPVHPPMRRRPGTYIGTGAIAPGRQHGFTSWAKAKSTATNLSEDKRGHIRFIFDIYSELGDKGSLWMEATSPEEESTRTRIFIKGLEK